MSQESSAPQSWGARGFLRKRPQTTVPSLEQPEDAVDIADARMHRQVPWMSPNKFVAAFCAVITLPASTFAMESAQLISALERFNDGNGAQQLAIKLAGLVEKADKVGLERLGERIEAEDGPLLSEIAGVAQREGDERTKFAAAMRPCQYANMFIRIIALDIANGTVRPVIRGGTVMIDGTDMDTDFAQHMWRCEILSQLPHKTSIGSKCAMTGVCKDDPDL